MTPIEHDINEMLSRERSQWELKTISTHIASVKKIADTILFAHRYSEARPYFQEVCNIGFRFYEAYCDRDPDLTPDELTAQIVNSVVAAVNGLALCNRNIRPKDPEEGETLVENTDELLMWGYEFARTFKSVRALQNLSNKAFSDIYIAIGKSPDDAQTAFLRGRFIFSQVYEVCNNLLEINEDGVSRPNEKLSNDDIEILIKLAAGTLNNEAFANLLLAELYEDPQKLPGTKSLGFLPNLQTAQELLRKTKFILNARPITGDNGKPSYSNLIANVYSNSALSFQLEIEHQLNLNPSKINFAYVTRLLSEFASDIKVVTTIFDLAEVSDNKPSDELAINFLTETRDSLTSEIRNRIVRMLLILSNIKSLARANSIEPPSEYLIQEGVVLASMFAWSPGELIRLAESTLSQDVDTEQVRQEKALHTKSAQLLEKAKAKV